MTGKKVTRRKFVADTGKIGLGVMIGRTPLSKGAAVSFSQS